MMDHNSSLAKRKINQINFFYNNRKGTVTTKLSDNKTMISIDNGDNELSPMTAKRSTQPTSATR